MPELSCASAGTATCGAVLQCGNDCPTLPVQSVTHADGETLEGSRIRGPVKFAVGDLDLGEYPSM